jgi:hypothetical protein
VLEIIEERTGYILFYQRHRCCSAAAILCSPYDEFNYLWFMHTNLNALERFLEKLVEWIKLCIEYLTANCRMRTLTAD